jgi:hypothetical protein
MNERDLYDEIEEVKQTTLTCPHCRQENTYPITWARRTKKAQLPAGANEADRAAYARATSYMVRMDDLAGCRNLRCRKRFELTGQTVVLI